MVGLPGAERAMLRMQPVLDEISACLTARGVVLPEMAFGNGRHRLQLQEISDGAYYKLEVQAPPSFFRDPAGYLFQVQDGQIVHRPGFAFRFRLVPPAEQDLPPCREFEKRFTPSSSEPAPNVTDIPAETQKDACRAEGTVDISTPPKQPERPREMGTLSVELISKFDRRTKESWRRDKTHDRDANDAHSAPPGDGNCPSSQNIARPSSVGDRLPRLGEDVPALASCAGAAQRWESSA
ncbi:MAG: hypothetical protein KatS3mg109_0179 [Pirellulaceae bacterium]|nr:MAG: hypothetical protein KatS3mg109_0179 [Pirellulaceae bacterium]